MDASKLFRTLVIGGGLIGCRETIPIETEDGVVEECCPERCFDEGCDCGVCCWLAPEPSWCSMSEACREAVTGEAVGEGEADTAEAGT